MSLQAIALAVCLLAQALAGLVINYRIFTALVTTSAEFWVWVYSGLVGVVFIGGYYGARYESFSVTVAAVVAMATTELVVMAATWIVGNRLSPHVFHWRSAISRRKIRQQNHRMRR